MSNRNPGTSSRPVGRFPRRPQVMVPVSNRPEDARRRHRGGLRGMSVAVAPNEAATTGGRLQDAAEEVLWRVSARRTSFSASSERQDAAAAKIQEAIMIMLNSVMVATDFGETSAAALQYGR